MRDSDSEDIKEVATDPESFEELLRFVYCDRVSEGAIEAMGEDLLKVCCPKGVEFSLPTLVINFIFVRARANTQSHCRRQISTALTGRH